MFPPALLTLVLLALESQALRSSTLPEDVHAFPKYKIQFLNGRPVLNETAQRWLQHGISDESEFLGLQKPPSPSPTVRKTIEGGPDDALASQSQNNNAPPSASPLPALQQMRLGASEFICLLLPPPAIPAAVEETQQVPQALHTWELLQPLEGTCLYHRQGWFSYAYCHGQHVRQFREKDPLLPLGLTAPLEDPNEPSYLLGHAPAMRNHDDETEGNVAVPDSSALANRLELARGAGHRYLNMHWGDGSVCDKTGRKREVEVQFHCSMTTTDSIFFIKETRTCQYTLVIHTPRLCGEPGFRSPRDDLQDTPLRCRKIVSSLDEVDQTLPDSSLPFHRPKPKPLPAPRNSKPATSGSGGGSGTGSGDAAGKTGPGANQGDKKAHAIRAALDSLFGRLNQNGANNNNNNPPQGGTQPKAGQGEQNTNGNAKLGDLGEGIIALTVDEAGEIRIDNLLDGDGKLAAALQDEDDGVLEIELAGGEDATRLLKILRDAGYDARLPGKDDEEKEEPLKNHDEL